MKRENSVTACDVIQSSKTSDNESTFRPFANCRELIPKTLPIDSRATPNERSSTPPPLMIRSSLITIPLLLLGVGGTSNEEGDGVQAALVNFRFLAHALWTTEEAVARFADLSRAARFNDVDPQRAEALTNSGSAS